MRKILFFKVAKFHFPSCKTWGHRGQKSAYEELQRELQRKRDSIEESFYIADAMVNKSLQSEFDTQKLAVGIRP